jgi:hypothetical protein
MLFLAYVAIEDQVLNKLGSSKIMKMLTNFMVVKMYLNGKVKVHACIRSEVNLYEMYKCMENIHF